VKILNVRAGFATNSSSSHSVLLFKGHGATDYDLGDGYNWSFFTVASAEMKKHYLASQLAESLGYDSWDATAEQNARILEIIVDLFGLLPEPETVDHQSCWSFPYDWDGETLSRGFIEDMTSFLTRDDVVILGGNDNVERDVRHPLNDAHPGHLWRDNLPQDERVHMIARRDEDHWTLFNRDTGMKVRVAFGEHEPASASAPELVDIKITDYCPFACTFCYVDSTKEGQHAPLADLITVAERLAAAEVFEVAIGGGEPTMHPDFKEIVDAFSSRGVTANFTTKNLAWLKDAELVEYLKPRVGAFAFSVTKADEVDKLANLLERAGWVHYDGTGGKRPNLHVVMGTVDEETFKQILARASEHNLGVTLLGWKQVGRATAGPTHPYRDWWLSVAKESGIYHLGIDTALAAESEQQLLDADIPRWMFHTEDGRWSGYVDAVQMTMGPSSWEPQRASWAFDEAWQSSWQASQPAATAAS
jgi:hypothetical protein